MLRRSHKKSWAGCVQCKKRHIKCDERRPVCVLCTLSDRTCSFSEDLPGNFSESGTSPYAKSAVQGPSPPDSMLSPMVVPSTDTDNVAEAINLEHTELLIHLISDREISSLAAKGEDYSQKIMFAINAGLKFPFLLYQLHAFSARHLEFLFPDRAAQYHHQAVVLQTRAISLFNATWTGFSQSNCAAVLLFSTILGHHLLADLLAKRDHASLQSFLTRYVHCVDVHRGIRTIFFTAWPMLKDTELEPILSQSRRFTSGIAKGDHCDRLAELVDAAANLNEKEKVACREAIRYLQLGFDAILGELEENMNPNEMIFLWTMLVPEDFSSMLVEARPETLVILAYYALLLHYGKNNWQVGDAGSYVFGSIVDYLGPEWQGWLDYPHAIIISGS